MIEAIFLLDEAKNAIGRACTDWMQIAELSRVFLTKYSKKRDHHKCVGYYCPCTYVFFDKRWKINARFAVHQLPKFIIN